MGLNTAQLQVKPLLPEGAEHHADGFVFILQNRPLFDMRLEIRADLMPADRPRSRIANRVQRIPHADPIGIHFGQGIGQGELFGKHA